MEITGIQIPSIKSTANTPHNPLIARILKIQVEGTIEMIISRKGIKTTNTMPEMSTTVTINTMAITVATTAG